MRIVIELDNVVKIYDSGAAEVEVVSHRSARR